MIEKFKHDSFEGYYDSEKKKIYLKKGKKYIEYTKKDILNIVDATIEDGAIVSIPEMEALKRRLLRIVRELEDKGYKL